MSSSLRRRRSGTGWREADRDAGADGLTGAERAELRRLKGENRRLRQAREILAKAAAWFARETGSVPLRVRESQPGHAFDCPDVPRGSEVSTSGYDAVRATSQRARADAALLVRIREIHAASRRTYGGLASMPSWLPRVPMWAAGGSPD